jgi:hypothetical protein
LEDAVEKIREHVKNASGKIGYILLWIMGVPVPVLLLIYFLRGCH